jgi:hypothetical protein
MLRPDNLANVSPTVFVSDGSLEIFWDPNRDSMVEVKDEEQAKDLEDLLSALREDDGSVKITRRPLSSVVISAAPASIAWSK